MKARTRVGRYSQRTVSETTNYVSGEDFVVEFLGYRFSFNAVDFEQRVNGAAVRLGLVEPGELEEEETADLVELTAHGHISDPHSALGAYLVRNWERVSLVGNESLVYWLRKLIFRGAWLDHRVKENLLEVAWDDDQSDFGYRDPHGGRALLELAPVPSWHELQYRR
jgi:hypothetical protein